MMKNDKQMLDMLRNEFEKSSESARVPLRLQKESMVAMLKKEADSENKETDFSVKTGTKTSKITNLRKYSAAAAMFALIALGAFVVSTNTSTIAVAQKDDFSSKFEKLKDEIIKNVENSEQLEKIVFFDFDGKKQNQSEQPHQSEQTSGPQTDPAPDGNDNGTLSADPQGDLSDFFSGYQNVDPAEKAQDETVETPGVIAPPETASPAVSSGSNAEVVAAHSTVEADTVKSAGDFLYVLTTSVDSKTGNITEKIEVVKKVGADNSMNAVSHIVLCENVVAGAYEECKAIQIHGNILIAILERKDFDTESKTIAKYYDINNPVRPVRTHIQDGKYLFSSVSGNNLLLFTDKGVQGSDYSVKPAFSVDGKETVLNLETDVFIPGMSTDNSYYFITVTDITDFGKPVGYFAAAGVGKQFNCFETAIVVTREWATSSKNENEPKGSITELFRFDIEGTKIHRPVITVVEGSVISGVYVNPKNENLMFVTSVTNGNRFYIIEKIKDSERNKEKPELNTKYVQLPEGKKVDAVRFMGKKALLISGSETTIINTALSPIVSISGTIPSGVKGSLYEISDSKLLEVYTDENGTVKFRLFDVSDPEHLSDATEYILEEKYNVISSLDSKSILLIPEKEMFGIPVVADDPEAGAEYSAYLIFNTASGKIEPAGICRHNEFYVSDAAVNAVYDSGIIYTVSGEKISAFSAETFGIKAKHEMK